MSEPGGNEYDPFSPENAIGLNFIATMRLCDILMAMLTLQDENLAGRLMEAHSKGSIVYPAPAFLGDFVADRLNTENLEPTGPPAKSSETVDNNPDDQNL